MEEHDEQRQRPAQEEEAASNHLTWRCDHTHWGRNDLQRGPAACPHRHVPVQQETLDLDGDLLAFNPVRWVVEQAGRDLHCRGIEVVSFVGRWVADPGHPAGAGEPAAARLRGWL